MLVALQISYYKTSSLNLLTNLIEIQNKFADSITSVYAVLFKWIIVIVYYNFNKISQKYELNL